MKFHVVSSHYYYGSYGLWFNLCLVFLYIDLCIFTHSMLFCFKCVSGELHRAGFYIFNPVSSSLTFSADFNRFAIYCDSYLDLLLSSYLIFSTTLSLLLFFSGCPFRPYEDWSSLSIFSLSFFCFQNYLVLSHFFSLITSLTVIYTSSSIFLLTFIFLDTFTWANKV